MTPSTDTTLGLAEALKRIAVIQAARERAGALLSCPFCGGEGALNLISDTWAVECMHLFECSACGPFADTPEEAVARWNRRLRS